MNKKTVLLAVISSVLLLGAGVLIFSPSPKIINDLSCDLSPQKNTDSKAGDITFSVMVDGSLSMLGYVKKSNSKYVKTLEIIYRTFSLSNPNNVEFFRSGKDKPISPQEFRKAKESEFYDGSGNFADVGSALDSAILPPGKEDKLFVLVTDLHIKQADDTKLNKKIQETYLNKKGYAAGLLAIKSEFNGEVSYYKGNNQERFLYNTQGKTSEKFRPFYILMMGPYKDIVKYMDKLIKSMKEQNIFKGSESVIFSPHNVVQEYSSLTEVEPNFDKIKLDQEKRKIKKLKVKSLRHVNVKGEDLKERIHLWKISGNHSQSLNIPYSVNYYPIDYSLPIDGETIETNVEVKKLNQNSSDKAQSFLNLEDFQIANKELNFKATIDPKSIQQTGTYYFNIKAVAKGLQDQEWWNAWSWNGNRDSPDYGSKTHNLSSFLKGLKTLTTNIMEEEPPIIGRFCYAIQKD